MSALVELCIVVMAICAVVTAICAIICAAHLAAVDEYADQIREYITYDVRMRHKDAIAAEKKQK